MADDSGEYRTVTFTIRPAQLAKIDAAAERAGLSRSAFLREAGTFCAGLQRRPDARRRVQEILAEHRTDDAEEPPEEEAAR